MSASPRILVVDDELGLRDLMEVELGFRGYRVATAANGREAVEKLLGAEYDLVITDLRMPDMGGLELLKAVKVAAPETEVLITTAYADLDTAVACLRLGAFDYVEKPVQIEALLGSITRALERRRLSTTGEFHAATEAIFTTGDTNQLPEIIVDIAARVMMADQVSLLLPDAKGTLSAVLSRGVPPDRQTQSGRRLSDRVAAHVATLRAPLLLPDPEGSAATADPRLLGLDLPEGRSAIVWPLLSGDRFLGVLYLCRLAGARPFRAADLERASVLAAHVVLSLENADLVRRLVASERLAAVGQLAASVAHEINNPAACILANLPVICETLQRLVELCAAGRLAPEAAVRDVWRGLEGEVDAPDALAAAADALLAVERIRDIVRDVRTLSRSEADEAPFDLNEAVRSAVRVSAAQTRGIADVVTMLGEDVRILGSAGRMTQVFTNLIVNAAQAITGQSAKVEQPAIVITTRSEPGSVIAEVTDSGPGIPPEHLEQVFEPFFTTKPAGQGTGLGLWISREIVRGHGGDLEVSSTVGRGTTFGLRFPALEPGARVEPPLGAGPRAAGAVPTPAPRRARILFVDDEPSIQRVYERTFSKEHEVRVVAGGREALALLEADQGFDAIVCDLIMPDLSGVEVYQRACQISSALGARFIFVTGAVAQRDVHAFLQRIPNHVLGKPFDPSTLAELLRAHAGADPRVTEEPH